MKKTELFKLETQWIITISWKIRRGIYTGVFCNSNTKTRKGCIESFIEWYGYDWKTAKKNGYNCVKAQISFTPNLNQIA